MQWSNLTKCGLFFIIYGLPFGPYTSSIAVVAIGFPWYTSHPEFLILEKVLNCRYYWEEDWYCFPAKCFFHVGEQKTVRWCQIGIWKMINQFTTYLCAGALSWWNMTPFISFPGHFEMSLLSSTTFQSPDYLITYKIQCGCVWFRKQCS